MIKIQSQKFIVFSNPRSSRAKCSPKESNFQLPTPASPIFKDINNSVSVKVEKLNECVRKLLKAIGTKKTIKKQKNNSFYNRCPSPISKSNLFYSAVPYFSIYTQVRIKKMVNNHSVNRQLIPSGLFSRIHSLIFL